MELMNHYEIESSLFRLLVETIVEEQKTVKTDGVEDLLFVFRSHLNNLGRLAVGQQPDYLDYEELLEAIVTVNELIQALAENHPIDVTDDRTQAGRMCALLIDVRADLEKTCWEVEDRMPQLRATLSETRAEKFIH
ncbi:MAG: hypothetical protein JSS95_03825 [Acidobacteria bacterium]|nr:hypothetical protein [Acidobacteriota bacterium]